jgi:beta-mannosidase
MNRTIDLCGTWELFWTDYERGRGVGQLAEINPKRDQPLAAEVPGEVHLDLIKAGLLDEPSVGLNCLKARWVEEIVWIYRRTFKTPKRTPGDRVFLVFEQLDLVAKVFLNGQEVGKHANVFCPLRLDVTDRLKDGENVLAVEIESGLYSVSERPAEGYAMQGSGKLHKRNWLRKAQSSFSWDWSQRLINVGISGPVRLEVCQGVRADGFVALAELSADLKQGKATGRLFVEGLDDTARKGTFCVEIEGAGVRKEVGVEIKRGPNRLEASVVLADPKLWWPIGHGNQPLYTVRGVLRLGGKVVAEQARRVGFRHVRINQDRHPESGRYFVIEVNGKPIFCKGGNFVPADVIFARISRSRYEALIDRAAM